LEQIKDKYQENLKNQDEIKTVDEEILQKQEKIQEMLNDLMSDEMKDLMKQIEDILQKMEKNNTFENLDKMELSNKDLKSRTR
jgi:CHASE3 domain sensor protein